MDTAVRDFLVELCRILRDQEDVVRRAIARDALALEYLYATPEVRERMAQFLANSDPDCLRIIKRVAGQVIFECLVVLDEGRELGVSGVRPRLSLTVGGNPIACPTHLHELLGDVMADVGMNPDEWAGIEPV